MFDMELFKDVQSQRRQFTEAIASGQGKKGGGGRHGAREEGVPFGHARLNNSNRCSSNHTY